MKIKGEVIALIYMKHIVFMFIYYALLVSCETNNASKIIHPTQENLLSDEEVSFLIRKDSINNGNSDLYLISTRIRAAQLENELGGPTQIDDNVLGSIIDASFHNGNIYLLDKQKRNISVYDMVGNYISTIARSGRGPGELSNPKTIIIHNDSLFVLNQHFDIQFYMRKSNVDGFEPYTQLNLKNRPDDFCINNGKLFVNTLPIADESANLEEANNISSFDLKNLDVETTTFGNMYISDSWFGKMHMSMGGILCSPNSSTIIQYFRYVGQLYAFDHEGEIVWKSKFNNFRHLELIEQGGSLGPDRSKPVDNFDVIENLVYLNDNFFIVQIFNREMSEDQSKTIIETYLVDFDTGEGAFISSNMPKILSVDFNAGVFITFENDKPTVSLFKF